MLLATVSELRTRLNAKDTERYNIALSGLLITASSAIETHLKTSFARLDLTEQFYIDPFNYRTNNPNALYLLLTGITQEDLKLQVVNHFSNMATPNPMDESYYKVDDRGVVTIFGGWNKGQYITANYLVGFEVSDDTGYPVYQNVPPVLKEACLLYAEEMFNTKYGSGEATGDEEGIPQVVLTLLSKYDRYAQTALRAR